MHRLSAFQRLALATTATTYVLILVGGLVRASGAGLGCPDWPRCFGSWIPPASAAELPAGFDVSQFNPTLMWTEYLNRLLGVTVGLLIFATLVSAWRGHRRDAHIFWPTLAAFLLVGFEGWLGGVVVEHELAPWIVTVHLVVALVIVTLLLYGTVYAFFGETATPDAAASRAALQRSVLAVAVLTLCQVALGAQVRGAIDDALAAGTARPAALASIGALDYWHRDLAVVVFAGALMIVMLVWTRHAHERLILRAAYLLAGLTIAQIAAGVVLAYVALSPPFQIAHLTLASLLLGGQTLLFLLARWLPPPQPPAAAVVSSKFKVQG